MSGRALCAQAMHRSEGAVMAATVRSTVESGLAALPIRVPRIRHVAEERDAATVGYEAVAWRKARGERPDVASTRVLYGMLGRSPQTTKPPPRRFNARIDRALCGVDRCPGTLFNASAG